MELHFKTVDVFTDQQFGGNPLAVILNAEGLSTAEMQAIAAEFNLSETTFVLPPEDTAHTAHIRIFTPRQEIPFAGHPNVGTAYVLGRIGGIFGNAIKDRVTFEEKAGLVEIDLMTENGAVTGATIEAPQPLSLGEKLLPETIAKACSLSADDIKTTNHEPVITISGMAFAVAELKSRETLSKAVPVTDVFAKKLPTNLATGVLLYVHHEAEGADIHVRMFAPLHGISEDPATGSANITLIGLLAHLNSQDDFTLSKTIAQGKDMGRPSLLYAKAEKTSGEVKHIWISGKCVSMMEGMLPLNK